MRGILSQPPRRAAAAPSALTLLLLAGTGCIATGLSGCASVSAGTAESLTAAKVSIVPSTVDFKTVVVGQKNSQTLTFTNTSKDILHLSSARVTGANFALVSAKLPAVLAPGKTTSVSIVFAPSSASARSGALALNSQDFAAPVDVPLAGEGEKAAPALLLSPATVSFGTHAANSSSFETVTLKNTGNVTVKLSAITVSNPAFSVSGLSNGVSIAPDQKLTFQLWFRPSVSGTWSATLSVTSAALPAPVKMAVAGSAKSTATAPTSSLSSHSVTLSWTASGSTVAGYHVYRGETSGGPYSRISPSTVNGESYLDPSVQPSAHYFYVVTAVESNGSESEFSNEVAADIPN
jgi:hypothetical protein